MSTITPDLLELALDALKTIVDLDDGDTPGLWPFEKELNEAREAIAELEAAKVAQPTAQQRYDELEVEKDGMSPLENLRAFCSFAMSGQDWLDVEPFFDALEAVQPVPPHECQTEGEKKAFAFGWWKALEANRAAQPVVPQSADLIARIDSMLLDTAPLVEPVQKDWCECDSWCREYGIAPRGEHHHRNCKHWHKDVGQAIVTKTELMVLGTPKNDDESHNCDFMGCGTFSHVLYRYPLASTPAVEPVQELCPRCGKHAPNGLFGHQDDACDLATIHCGCLFLIPVAPAVELPVVAYHCIGYVDGYGTEIKDKSASMKAPRPVYVQAAMAAQGKP